jgi:hypothetical protein
MQVGVAPTIQPAKTQPLGSVVPSRASGTGSAGVACVLKYYHRSTARLRLPRHEGAIVLTRRGGRRTGPAPRSGPGFQANRPSNRGLVLDTLLERIGEGWRNGRGVPRDRSSARARRSARRTGPGRSTATFRPRKPSSADHRPSVTRMRARWCQLCRSAWSSMTNCAVTGAPKLSEKGAARSSSSSVNAQTAAAA